MITKEQGAAFAAAWVEAWNNHDLDAVMHHYSEEIRFTSPFIVSIAGDATGTITDKESLRGYFQKALGHYPDLRFELYTVLTSVDSVVLYYRSIKNLLAAEYMELDAAGKVIRVKAHYSEG